MEWEERRSEGRYTPLLDLVEAGEERDRDEDDDCFFAVADFELFGFDKGERGAFVSLNSTYFGWGRNVCDLKVMARADEHTPFCDR